MRIAYKLGPKKRVLCSNFVNGLTNPQKSGSADRDKRSLLLLIET